MASYKDPSFQDRVASAAQAKQKALDKLRAKPPVDPAVMAKRREAWEAQDKARSEERAAKAEADAAARAEKASVKAAQEMEVKTTAALKAARLTPASAAEMKSARDARYAARQARRK
ncbi:MAG TPA: DUF6481 family protein [Pyrinomonadaceae bacterium]|nr:DUF6481 family protein [Pyrinomonadaceae bacterium]